MSALAGVPPRHRSKPGGGSAGKRSSWWSGLRGRQRGRCMAISTMAIGRCYRQARISSGDVARALASSRRALARQRREGRPQDPGIAHGRTSDSVEHPERNLQHATAWLYPLCRIEPPRRSTSPRRRERKPSRQPKDARDTNGPLVEGLSNVGVLSFSCTIGSAFTGYRVSHTNRPSGK